MNRLDDYDMKLINAIFDLGNYESPSIWSRDHNSLSSLWVRNYKDKIRVETLMGISVKPYKNLDSKDYESNFFFEITPKQAEEIIKELQGALKRRKKGGKK